MSCPNVTDFDDTRKTLAKYIVYALTHGRALSKNTRRNFHSGLNLMRRGMKWDEAFREEFSKPEFQNLIKSSGVTNKKGKDRVEAALCPKKIQKKGGGGWNSFNKINKKGYVIGVRTGDPTVLERRVSSRSDSRADLDENAQEELQLMKQASMAGVAPLLYGARITLDRNGFASTRILSKAYDQNGKAFLKAHADGENLPWVGRELVRLFYLCADMGLCHTDVKLDNIVVNLHPLEVKLIDFDNRYTLQVGRDVRIFSFLPSENSCDTLRLFYVVVMMALMCLDINRHETEYSNVLHSAIEQEMKKISGPFARFFTPGATATYTMRKIYSRILHYGHLEHPQDNVGNRENPSLYAQWLNIVKNNKPEQTMLPIVKRFEDYLRTILRDMNLNAPLMVANMKYTELVGAPSATEYSSADKRSSIHGKMHIDSQSLGIRKITSKNYRSACPKVPHPLVEVNGTDYEQPITQPSLYTRDFLESVYEYFRQREDALKNKEITQTLAQALNLPTATQGAEYVAHIPEELWDRSDLREMLSAERKKFNELSLDLRSH